MIRALQWLDRLRPETACLAGGFLIFVIGILSYLNGPQFSGSFLYLVPILLITRVAGFRAGIVAALLAALIWLAADLKAGLEFSHPVIPFWNASMRLGTFVVAVSLVAALGALNAQLEERVKERTAALEDQIAENRELEERILDIGDKERAAVGQDLHDGLCQQLVSAAFSANMLHEKLAPKQQPGARETAEIADLIDEAITQARNLARGLYPVRLETEGLEMALRELADSASRRFGIDCTVECLESMPPFRGHAAIHLYRIAQEAVVNAVKHADARQVLITLSRTDARLRLVIADDGTGIDLSSANPMGMGLRIMEYRARMIGADFTIEAGMDGGTRVICELDCANQTIPD